MPTPPKNFNKIFSELQELEVRICVQPDFPIIILILLTDFHKFSKPRGPNISAPRKLLVKRTVFENKCWFSPILLAIHGYNLSAFCAFKFDARELVWSPPCVTNLAFSSPQSPEIQILSALCYIFFCAGKTCSQLSWLVLRELRSTARQSMCLLFQRTPWYLQIKLEG